MLLAAGFHALLALFRWRLPAFFVFGPAAGVVAGAGAWAMVGDPRNPYFIPVPGSPDDGAAMLEVAFSLAPIGVAAFAVAGALAIAGLPVALVNGLRAGPKHKWTLGQAVLGGLLVVPAIAGAAWAGVEGLPVVVLGMLAVPLASLRIGVKQDKARMVAGRGFVAAMYAVAAGAIGLGHVCELYYLRLMAWAYARPFEETPFSVLGDTFAVVMLIVAGLIVTAPFANALLRGRTAFGLLFSVFLAAPVAIGVAPPLVKAASFTKPNPAAGRQLTLRRWGIELVDADGDAWTPMPTVTVGPYWAYWEGEELVPFKLGRVPREKLLDGVAVDLLDQFTQLDTGRLGVELDRNVGFRALEPVLRAAQSAGLHDLRFTTRTNTGALRTLPVSVAPASDDGLHVLVAPDGFTWIEGDTARETNLEELRDKAFVAHIDETIMAPQLVELLGVSDQVTLWLR